MNILIYVAAACLGVVDIHEAPLEPDASREPAEDAAWSSSMQALAATFTDLVPLLTSAAAFGDLHNADTIRNDIARLVTITETMHRAEEPNAMAFPDRDPTLPLVSRMMATSVENAYMLFSYDETEPARLILRSTISRCATCHSRGPEEVAVGMFSGPINMAGFKTNERVALNLALRRLDDARVVVARAIANDAMMRQHPTEWLAVAQLGLSIAVQIDDSPAQAHAIARALIASDLPRAQRDEGRAWDAAITAWESEPGPAATLNRVELARKLIGQAQEALGNSSANREADIYNLRAAALLHTYLRGSAGGTDTSDALFLLGQAYEGLVNFEMWDLPGLYYEACIHISPHTRVARMCFERYRQGVFTDYGDWAVKTLPLPVAEDLFELENLSAPN